MRGLLGFFCCLAAFTALGSDWRQFRGPQGSGVADELNVPTTLDPQRHVGWKTDLPGRGLSSPIVVGDRIFVTCCSGARQERLHVICFNASDGTRQWERQFWATGRTTCHEKISVAAPTPVSDGQRLFALFSSNDLVCLDLDGQLLWLRGLMLDYPNASNNLGLSSSPVVADGTLLVQVEADGAAFVAGIDALTGMNRWKLDRPKRVNWTSPLSLSGKDGKAVFLLQSSQGVTAVDAASGTTLWNYAGGADAVASSSLQGETLFVPSHGVTALQLGGEGQPATTVWQSNLLRPSTASPLVLGSRIFTLNDAGVLTCGDCLTGKRVWQLRLKGPITATPVSAGQHLYVVNEQGLIQVVNPAAPEGEIVSQLELGETILATPSISSGAIYLRSDRRLWKISNGKPAISR
jgi:outer membrane protein assembly factor BamB